MNSGKLLVGATLVVFAITAWTLTILNIGPMMGMPSLPLDFTALAFFTLAWTVGMVAMMFPTAIPMLLMFFTVGRNASNEIRQGGGPTPWKALLFVGTYLGAWVMVGVAFYVAAAVLLSGLFATGGAVFITTTFGLGAALVLVALYQLSPIKGECLARCHPSSFLFRYYRGGLSGASRMGLDYAKYCVGCCWGMMVFLMISASMGVIWMAAFSAIIFAERSLPMRAWIPKLFGVGFLFAGAALLLV